MLVFYSYLHRFVLRGGGGGVGTLYTHSVESLIRIYHKLKETIYYMKIGNSSKLAREKRSRIFKYGVRYSFFLRFFLAFFYFLSRFSRVKFLKKVSALPWMGSRATMVPGSPWAHMGPTWVPCWTHVGPTWVPCWTHVGPTWSNMGAMLDPCWSNMVGVQCGLGGLG